MSKPPAKRQKKDSTSDSSKQKKVTRSDIWYSDGNIILEAESTQFRVHKSILSYHSSVFDDMFQLPQPHPSLEDSTVDGCSVVLLSDKAADVHNILDLIYHRTIFDQMSFSFVIASIRLGRKYRFLKLRAEAIRRLCLSFPSKLEDRDSARWELEEKVDEVLFDVIALAREEGPALARVLPAAYYVLVLDRAVFNVNTLLDGFKREDGSLAFLSPIDQKCLLSAWENLESAYRIRLYGWLKLPANGKCSNSKVCELVRLKAISAAWTTSQTIFIQDIHTALKDTMFGVHQKNLCSNCSTEWAKYYEIGRQGIWKFLPTFFGLPQWEDLLVEDDVV